MPYSDYERQRDATAASNRAKLHALGIEPLCEPRAKRPRPPSAPKEPPAQRPKSSRLSELSPQPYAEPRHGGKLEHAAAPQPAPTPTPAPTPPPPPPSATTSYSTDGTRVSVRLPSCSAAAADHAAFAFSQRMAPHGSAELTIRLLDSTWTVSLTRSLRNLVASDVQGALAARGAAELAFGGQQHSLCAGQRHFAGCGDVGPRVTCSSARRARLST